MIKDFFVSFKDNFKEKARNPFLGTYLIVWLIRNWELVYTIFNFDKDQKLNDKVSFIKNYYSGRDFLCNLWTNVYWSFGLLVFTYILLNLSRLIVNLFEKRLTPLIYKITDSKSIVLKSAYEKLRSDKDDLQTRLDLERESKSRLESRIKILEEELVETAKQKAEKQTEPLNDRKNSNNNSNDSAYIMYKKLKEKNLLRDFMDTYVQINKGETIKNDYLPKDYFVELGLMTFTRNSEYNSSYKYYILTEDGENVLKLARLEKE